MAPLPRSLECSCSRARTLDASPKKKKKKKKKKIYNTATVGPLPSCHYDLSSVVTHDPVLVPCTLMTLVYTVTPSRVLHDRYCRPYDTRLYRHSLVGDPRPQLQVHVSPCIIIAEINC